MNRGPRRRLAAVLAPVLLATGCSTQPGQEEQAATVVDGPNRIDEALAAVREASGGVLVDSLLPHRRMFSLEVERALLDELDRPGILVGRIEDVRTNHAGGYEIVMQPMRRGALRFVVECDSAQAHQAVATARSSWRVVAAVQLESVRSVPVIEAEAEEEDGYASRDRPHYDVEEASLTHIVRGRLVLLRRVAVRAVLDSTP